MAHFNQRMTCYTCGRLVFIVEVREDGEYAAWPCGAVLFLPKGERKAVTKSECAYREGLS